MWTKKGRVAQNVVVNQGKVDRERVRIKMVGEKSTYTFASSSEGATTRCKSGTAKSTRRLHKVM